jgi:hypothetical protein
MLFFIEFDPDHFFWTCRFRRSLNPTFTVTTAWWFRGAACATALSEWRTSLGPLKRTGSVSPSPGMGPVGPCWMFGPGHRKATAKCFPSRRFPKSHRGTSRISKSCYFRNFLWSFTIFFTMSFTIQRLLGYPGIQPWLWRKLPMTDTSRPLNRPPSHVVPQSASTGPRLVRTSSVRGRRDGTFSDPLHGI